MISGKLYDPPIYFMCQVRVDIEKIKRVKHPDIGNRNT